jgi:hypothetical protein
LTALLVSVPALTKAVPSALFDRYREAYRRVAQGRTWERVGVETAARQQPANQQAALFALINHETFLRFKRTRQNASDIQ